MATAKRLPPTTARRVAGWGEGEVAGRVKETLPPPPIPEGDRLSQHGDGQDSTKTPSPRMLPGANLPLHNIRPAGRLTPRPPISTLTRLLYYLSASHVVGKAALPPGVDRGSRLTLCPPCVPACIARMLRWLLDSFGGVMEVRSPTPWGASEWSGAKSPGE